MSENRKTRKQYRPRTIALPLGIRNAVAFEMPGFQGMIALGQPHFCEQHLYDLLSNADMVRRIAPDGHEILPIAQDMVEAIAAVQERAQRVGRYGVTGEEMKVLRDGLVQTMAYLRTVPNTKIIRATSDALAEFDRLGALRV